MVYRLTWVIYTSRCSSGFVVSSYFSIVKFCQLEGTVDSMMLVTKGFLNCDNYLPKVLENERITSERTLRLMALGRPNAVDLASPPFGKLASSCCDLYASWR